MMDVAKAGAGAIPEIKVRAKFHEVHKESWRVERFRSFASSTPDYSNSRSYAPAI